MPDAVRLVPGLAAGRCGLGVAALLRPSLLGAGLGVDAATTARTAWLTRMFAVRDLVLGVGTLQALRSAGRGGTRRAELRRWLALGAACDAVDALAMADAARVGQLRPLPAAAGALTALGAVAVGVGALAGGDSSR